jgi:hypothetical protein
MIEQEFVYNELESLGFFEWLSETHNLKDTDMKPEYLDELPLNDIHRTVCNSMALRWFREKYGLYSCIMYSSDGIIKGGYSPMIDVMKPHKATLDLNTYDIYEEAELACLRRLIEIVKTI